MTSPAEWDHTLDPWIDPHRCRIVYLSIGSFETMSRHSNKKTREREMAESSTTSYNPFKLKGKRIGEEQSSVQGSAHLMIKSEIRLLIILRFIRSCTGLTSGLPHTAPIIYYLEAPESQRYSASCNWSIAPMTYASTAGWRRPSPREGDKLGRRVHT